MKNTVRFFLPVLFIMLFTAQNIFADSVDSYLKDYEKFVVKVEKYAEEKNYKMLDKIYSDQGKFDERRKKLDTPKGDWTFNQGAKIGALSARYGAAVGVLNTQKGLKKTQDFFEDKDDNSSDTKNKKDA